MRRPSVQLIPLPTSPFYTPERQQPGERTGKNTSRDLASGTVSPEVDGNLRTLPSQSHASIVGTNEEVGTRQTILRIRNGKSWRHEREGVLGLPETGRGQADVHSDILGLLPASPSLTPFHCAGTHGPSPSKQVGRRPGREPGARHHRGQEIKAAPTHLRLHGQLRATRARRAQWKRTGRRDSRDPRSLASSRQKARALRTQGISSPAPHPPRLNSNRRYPSHLPPHSGANRRRRHSRGPIAAPSASRGHTPRSRLLVLAFVGVREAAWLVTLPASFHLSYPPLL